MLYLAENDQVALYEVGGLLRPIRSDPVVDPRRLSWIILSHGGRALSRVVDLGDEGQRAIIGTTFQELTGDLAMTRRNLSPSQALGLALYRLPKVEGFLYPSARVGGRKSCRSSPRSSTAEARSLFRNDLDGTIERLT